MSSRETQQRTPLLSIHQLDFSYTRDTQSRIQSCLGSVFKGSKDPSSEPFALKQVSLDIYPQEMFGLIGESTCGKSTLARNIIQLLRSHSGCIQFNGDGFADKDNVRKYSSRELSEYRKRVQMVFQNCDASLNPGMKVKELIIEAIQSCPGREHADEAELHRKMSKYLRMMNLQGRESYYPDTLSGGEKRRVGIIRALALEPDLIIADEPFANLDVSLRNHLINLFRGLRSEKKQTFLFILHDMDIARYLCDRIAVMYHGRIVEVGATKQLFDKTVPKHPYTATLIVASETLKDASAEEEFNWQPPELVKVQQGCPYRSQCAKYNQELTPEKRSECEESNPGMTSVGQNHEIACHFWQEWQRINTGGGLS